MTKSDLSRSDRLLAVAICAVMFAMYVAFCIRSLVGAKGGYDSHGVLFGNDFVVFWTASTLVQAGNFADIFNIEAFNGWLVELVGPPKLPSADGTPSTTYYPWLYPPPGLFPILPLAFLSYFWAYGVWCATSVAVFVWAALGARWRSLDGIALTIAPPTFACLLAGQNGLFAGALLVGGLRILEARPILAGILFGLLGFKPHLGLLIPVALIAAQNWRAFAAASVTIVALYGASVLAFGPESWDAYLVASTRSHYDSLLGSAVGPYLNVSATPYIAAKIIGIDGAARIVVQVLFTAAAGLGVFFAFKRRVPVDLRNAILLSAFVLASPFGYFYDLPAIAMAVLIAYREGMRTGFMAGERVAITVAWLTPIVIVALNKQGVPLGPIALATLFVYLCARAFQWFPASSLAAGIPPPVRA